MIVGEYWKARLQGNDCMRWENSLFEKWKQLEVVTSKEFRSTRICKE